jgi:uncharacterized protein YndB with AHSA1/START domain
MNESTQSIEVDYDLSQPPEKVWRVLTEPMLLARWLMENDIKPEVGHKFTFRGAPIPGRWDGRVECEVLAVEPMRLLRYSWKGGSDQIEGDGGRLDTVVTWTLDPTPTGGTKLHLSHAGFTEKNRFAFENMGKGWRSHLAQRIAQALA